MSWIGVSRVKSEECKGCKGSAAVCRPRGRSAEARVHRDKLEGDEEFKGAAAPGGERVERVKVESRREGRIRRVGMSKVQWRVRRWQRCRRWRDRFEGGEDAGLIFDQ